MPGANRPGPECGRACPAPYTEAAAAVPECACNPLVRMPGTDISPRDTNAGRWPIHDLRGLDGRIAKDERVVVVESEDECRRDEHGMDTGENKFFCIESPLRADLSGPERSGADWSVHNHL